MVEETGKRLRLAFLGTPDFAAAILEKILSWPSGEIVGVFTQPDRPCGRGRKCTPPPVKQLALQHSLPVFQPEDFKTEQNFQLLSRLQPDLLLVAAYGLILPKPVLDLPDHGAINVHASLLPKYRGAAPIQRAIMNGESATGVTIMQVVPKMDAGPILLQRAMAIGIDDTAQTLHDQLAEMGGDLLLQALDKLIQGKLHPIDQDEALATYAPKLKKSDGLISWNKPALEVHNHIRGVHPWPGAFFPWSGIEDTTLQLTIYPGKIGEPLEKPVTPGTILGREGKYISIACTDRSYLVPFIKPAGGKPLDAESFFCGYLSRCT